MAPSVMANTIQNRITAYDIILLSTFSVLGYLGFIRFITDEILEAIGETRDPGEACRRNVRHAVDRIEREFSSHPEIREPLIRGAVFDLESGEVSWLDGR